MGAAGMGIPSAYAIGCADLNEVLLETPDPGFGKEARWGQRAPPPPATAHSITSASPFTLNVTVEFSATSPAMSARASLVSICRCRNRFNGRAPNTGY